MKLIPELRFPEFDRASEWQLQPLRKVLIKNSKKNKSLKHNLVQSVSNKHGFINQEDYFDNRRVASKDTSNYYVIKKGYFAYNPSRIDVGSLAYQHENITSIISPLYVSFQANYEEVDDIFLLNWFFSDQFSSQLIFEGGVRNTLSFENLVQINITLPSIPEQQKIASCLSSLDELIAAHNDKLDALKDHKKGLLQNLFPQEGESVPKVRFSEFEGDGEWVEKELSEVSTIITGSTPSTKVPEYYGGDIMFVSPADISNNKYVESTEKTLSLEGFEKTRKIKANSVMFVCIGSTIGKVAMNKFECATNQQINSLVPNNENSSDFLYSNLELNAFKISGIAGNQAVPIINKTLFSSVKLKFPPTKEEQQKIASCLSAVDELITAQQEKIEQLQQHKKGLMQGLFPKIES